MDPRPAITLSLNKTNLREALRELVGAVPPSVPPVAGARVARFVDGSETLFYSGDCSRGVFAAKISRHFWCTAARTPVVGALLFDLPDRVSPMKDPAHANRASGKPRPEAQSSEEIMQAFHQKQWIGPSLAPALKLRETRQELICGIVGDVLSNVISKPEHYDPKFVLVVYGHNWPSVPPSIPLITAPTGTIPKDFPLFTAQIKEGIFTLPELSNKLGEADYAHFYLTKMLSGTLNLGEIHLCTADCDALTNSLLYLALCPPTSKPPTLKLFVHKQRTRPAYEEDANQMYKALAHTCGGDTNRILSGILATLLGGSDYLPTLRGVPHKHFAQGFLAENQPLLLRLDPKPDTTLDPADLRIKKAANGRFVVKFAWYSAAAERGLTCTFFPDTISEFLAHRGVREWELSARSRLGIGVFCYLLQVGNPLMEEVCWEDRLAPLGFVRGPSGKLEWDWTS